jgi:Calcineurin-like phosphoesterase superfamily domain
MAVLKAVIVVLSDMHLGPGYEEEVSVPPVGTQAFVRMMGMKGPVQNFFQKECRAHDAVMLEKVPLYLRHLVRMAQIEEEYEGSQFDLYLLLGDQVTWPSPASFAFCRDFLENDEWRPVGTQRKYFGLGLSKRQIVGQLIAIPGNHDKLLAPDLDNYYTNYTDKLGLGRDPGPQSAHLEERKIGDINICFGLLDASAYTKVPDMLAWPECRTHLARGEVTTRLEQQARWLALEMRSRKGFKFLVLHYAVAQSASIVLNTMLPHECDGIERIVPLFKDTVNAVVHGHLHRAELDIVDGVRIVSAGTVCQKNNKQNGMFLLKMYDTGQLRAEHHVWDDNWYKPDPEHSRPLN